MFVYNESEVKLKRAKLHLTEWETCCCRRAITGIAACILSRSFLQRKKERKKKFKVNVSASVSLHNVNDRIVLIVTALSQRRLIPFGWHQKWNRKVLIRTTNNQLYMLSPSLFLYLVLFSAYLFLGQVLISNSAPSTRTAYTPLLLLHLSTKKLMNSQTNTHTNIGNRLIRARAHFRFL